MSRVFFCVAQNTCSSCKSGFYPHLLHLQTLGLLQPKNIENTENKEEDVSRNLSRCSKKMRWEAKVRDQHLCKSNLV